MKTTFALPDPLMKKTEDAAKALGITTDKLLRDVIEGYFEQFANTERINSEKLNTFDAKTISELLPKYICHRCVSKVLEYNEKGTFGGEESAMTVMFIDIRGFTTMSEKIGPEDAMRVLNAEKF